MPLARTLMVQGTASSVGKSLLVTALCRHFAAKGLSVSPFKGLNMALNAHVTPDGKEIARAQAVQAEACGMAPHVEMNPILLKPEGEKRSQLVLLGKAVGVFGARDLHTQSIDLKSAVLDALAALRARHDLVIIEGAGSPAEVNLKERDLANMFVARAVKAPVLLAGDIDRGGVLAAFVGTLALLDAEERALVAGLLINKFRGDLSLLEPALSFLREHTGVPVVGVMPHLGRHGVAEEDSLEVDARMDKRGERATVDVYVIRLPHISNHDEFQPLELEPDVSLTIGDDLARAYEADLLVVPGSKSTVRDLGYLRERGFDHVIALRARTHRPVLGVCGGCQMLGQRIIDEHGVESSTRESAGLGHLPIETRFLPNKRTERVRIRPARESWLTSGLPADAELAGYYIHAGRTTASANTAPLFHVECDGASNDGSASETGDVLGTMVHGLFENDVLRHAVIDALRSSRGLGRAREHARFDRLAAYERLAASLRVHCDMTRIERLALG